MSSIELTDEIAQHVNGALMAGNPMVLASVDAEGKPRLSFRGSVSVVGPDQLGVWARNPEGGTVGAVGANPNVALIYRRPTPVTLLQFFGRARVVEGAERDLVFDSSPEYERKADPEKKGVGLIIDLDKVEGLLAVEADGTRRFVRMTRD
jgi:Pyridoxamine 5'-phosphate oxidase